MRRPGSEDPHRRQWNYLVLSLKKFIWSCKFKNVSNLSIVGFKNYFGYVLNDLRKLYDLKNKHADFYVRNDLLNLFPAAAPQVQDGQPATQVHDLLLP